MLHNGIQSSIVKILTVYPANSMAWYVPPETDISPIIYRIRSFASRKCGISPSITNLSVAGTFTNNFPMPIINLASVFPIPLANCPNAPALQVWESVPNKTWNEANGTGWIKFQTLLDFQRTTHILAYKTGEISTSPGLQWPSWARAIWQTPL